MAPNTDEPTGSCPFCGGEVSENLLLFGGTCPRCLGTIPGEEVATHPGFAEIEKMQVQDDKKARRRTLLPFLLGATGLGGLGLLAVGFVIWNQDPVVEPLNFDELDPFEYEITAAPTEDEAAKPEPTKPVKPRPVKDGVASAPKPASVPQPAGTPEPAVAAAPQPRKPGILQFNEPGVQVAREGVELKEPDQITNMIRKVMQANAPTLSDCYNQALERDASLEGRWRASFTVGKNGFAKDIQFTGRGAEDAAMETCLAGRVAQWRFSKIAVDQPVQKTWKFSR